MNVRDLVKSSDTRLNWIDYFKFQQDNKEFLRGDMWEFKMDAPPAIVYYPGDEIFKYRLNAVNLGLDTGVTGIEKRTRGNFVLFQRTGQNTSGSISLSFTDREDQAISYFLDDWRQKISDRATKYSFRKCDLVCNCTLFLLNSGRQDVRTLHFYNCIIRDAGMDENGVTEDGSDRSEVSLSMDFEYYTRDFDNLI